MKIQLKLVMKELLISELSPPAALTSSWPAC
jgi:hypothetical protein